MRTSFPSVSPEGSDRLLPVLPSGAIDRNRRNDGRFRVRGGRIERSGFARKQGFQPSRGARARCAEIGSSGGNAARLAALKRPAAGLRAQQNPRGGPVGRNANQQAKPAGKDLMSPAAPLYNAAGRDA